MPLLAADSFAILESDSGNIWEALTPGKGARVSYIFPEFNTYLCRHSTNEL
jgi:hypothetical protein